MDDEFSSHLDFWDADGVQKNVFVKVLEVSRSYVKFLTMNRNTVFIPWHQVVKLKIHGEEGVMSGR